MNSVFCEHFSCLTMHWHLFAVDLINVSKTFNLFKIYPKKFAQRSYISMECVKITLKLTNTNKNTNNREHYGKESYGKWFAKPLVCRAWRGRQWARCWSLQTIANKRGHSFFSPVDTNHESHLSLPPCSLLKLSFKSGLVASISRNKAIECSAHNKHSYHLSHRIWVSDLSPLYLEGERTGNRFILIPKQLSGQGWLSRPHPPPSCPPPQSSRFR